MNGLSLRQAEIYRFIMDYHRHNGYSPSLREIACGIGVSLTTATAHVTALRGKGCIDWEPNSARSIHVVKQGAT